MSSHDFLDDSQAQAGALTSRASSSPETFENMLPLFRRDPWTMIGDLNAAVRAHGDRHFLPFGKVRNGVLYEVADRILDRRAVAPEIHGVADPDEGYGPSLAHGSCGVSQAPEPAAGR